MGTPEMMSEQSVSDWIYEKCATVQKKLVIQIQSLGSRVADLLKQRKIMFTS